MPIPTIGSSATTNPPRHPLSNFAYYNKFSKNHQAFLESITSNEYPKYFSQALKDARWIEALKKGVTTLEKNGTWSLMELLVGKRDIDSKWVYKLKYKPTGEVERFKARLVAK